MGARGSTSARKRYSSGGYNEGVLRFVVAAVLASATALFAQTPLFPLKDVRAGMRGVGRTVFSGSQVEDFQVEILGVLDNAGPKESLIIARLSGGAIDRTGVMQGMSGSPVYIDGKLVGAVAAAFPFSKEAISGIRPIEDMVTRAFPTAPSARPSVALGGTDILSVFSKPEPVMAGGAQMADIATPVAFGGFSRNTLDAFAPQLRSLGLDPRQGVTAGANLPPELGNPADLKPGSMISVQLMAGDLSVGADGTVTYIDGSRVYAFGHRFLAVGATALPFALADVIALVPNVNTSFKLSAGRQWMGTISQDRESAISGELGKLPEMAPVTISVSREGRPIETYRMRMVKDQLLSPLLIQMAIYSAIDVTERTVGASSIRLTGEIDFQGSPAPVKVAGMYAMDNGAAAQASISAAIPAAYVMQAGYDALSLRSVTLNIDASDDKKSLNIDSVTASKQEARPGETVRLYITLTGENGREVTREADYAVPIGAGPGMLYFTVADASTTNVADFKQTVGATPRDAGQVIGLVNSLHPNNKIYVRVWRSNTAYQLEGADLPDPPASVSLMLGAAQSGLAGITQTRNSKIAAIEIDAGDVAVNGSRTVQVEIKQ